MVTDEDRAKGRAMYDSWFGGDEMDDEIITDIAAALAAEREKARAPFLALADEIEAGHGRTHTVLHDCHDRIRRAAQDEP